MIQVHGKTILLIEFKSMIKAHDLNPWQFIYPKPNFHWQHQSPILIENIKNPTYVGTIQNSILIGNIKAQFSLVISKPNFHWQHQNPILIGNIKSLTYVGTI